MILGYLDIGGKNSDTAVQHRQISQYAEDNALNIDIFFKESDIDTLKTSLTEGNHTVIIANVVALGTSLISIKKNIASLTAAGVTIISAKEGFCFSPDNAEAVTKGIELVIGIRSSLSSIVTRKALAERKAAGVVLGRRVPNSKHVFDHKENIIKQKLAQKMTKVQIAKDLGVSQGYLYAFLKQHPELKPETKGDGDA